MIKNYAFKGILAFILSIALFSSCSKKDSGGGTSPTVDSSDESIPAPQPSSVTAPFIGLWENSSISIVFLTDGRTAIIDRDNARTPIQTGYYHVEADRSITFEWRLTGHEVHITIFNGSTLTLGTSNLQQRGSAANAESYYNQIYQYLINYSIPFNNQFTVGAMSGNPNPSDPNPGNILQGATVYNGAGQHFADSFGGTEWYDMPDHSVNAYDSYSRADFWLMPNGRFCSEIWLWEGVDVHDYAHVKHVINWGKYTVTPATDLVQGDIITCYYDTGRKGIYRAVAGRRYLRTASIIYHNWALK